MKNVIYLLLVLVVTASSCRKDFESEEPTFILVGEDVITHLHGRVVDPTGRSITEAEVTVEERTVFTNIDGYFYFPSISVPNDGFVIKVRSQNNDRAIRRIIPQAETNTYEEIILPFYGEYQMFDTEQSNDIRDPSGTVRITIPANALVNENSISYQGSFNARVKYYDPSDILTMRTMPSNLQGVDKDGAKVSLGSYGMFDIEVIGTNGETLQLGDDRTADVQLFFSGELIESALSSIPTWVLDESSGLWVESGEANLFTNDTDVTYFSFGIDEFASWNCDIKEQNTSLSGIVIDETGVPIENRLVLMTFTSGGNNFFSTGGNTNSRGEFETKVPKGKIITLSLYDENCGKRIHTEEIDPITEDNSKIDVITLITEDSYTISGNLFDCEDLPLGNATVFLFGATEQVRASTQTEADGSFAIHNICFGDGFSLKVLNLNTFTSFSIDGFPFTEIDLDIGNYYECEESTEFINVSSQFEFISFNNPEAVLDGDSLVITAETNFGSFLLIAGISADGNNYVDHVEIRIGDQTLTCTSEFSHTTCSDAVSFNIIEKNVDLQLLTGSIDGLLYTGNISIPDSTIGSDVSIDFRVNY